jgi:hypothetical protein
MSRDRLPPLVPAELSVQIRGASAPDHLSYRVAQCVQCRAMVLSQPGYECTWPERCSNCGTYQPPIVFRGAEFNMKFWQSGVSRSKGLLVRSRRAIVPQQDRGGALAHHHRVFDQRTDRYNELVAILDTGEVVHFCDEPLSLHQGHGSARQLPHEAAADPNPASPWLDPLNVILAMI